MKCLVVGYGSIGRRHEAVLRAMGKEVAVVSRHARDLDCPVFADLKEALLEFDPQYVVVSNRTSEHLESLQQLQSAGFKGTCLVEKPLFESLVEGGYDFDVWVGYVMRFHPVVQQAAKLLEQQKLLSIQAYVGQYLPDWRPDTDYRQCYSANKAQGGGVLRDLSHELDYILKFAGSWKRVSALGGHLSELEIETDDVFGLLIEVERCPVVLCQMNYLDRNVRRDCTIQYEGGTLYLDFINNQLVHNGSATEVNMERNDTFEAMHEAALISSPDWLCSYKEAAQTLELITAAEKSSKESRWVCRKNQ